MDVERIIDDIEQLQEMFEVPDIRTSLIVRPNGADHQRGKDPPRQMLVRSGS